MRIPDGKIEEIRASADIVDVVSGFIRLRKVGRNFVGLCPFHQEKTPSFNVNPVRGIYKCFGCGRGGNVFTFLMEYEKISFAEAARDLAERYGIAVVQESQPGQPSREQLDALYDVMRTAARFFFDTLRQDEDQTGADYCLRRQWTPETQKRFGIGYAPDSWDRFLNHARQQGIPEDLLEEAGLIVRKENGKAYDRFRNRLIFPIFSATRKVIAFGARALKPGDEPKYLNSPETPVYHKSKALYGLPMAIGAIREQDAVILVEGYADVISMNQAGIENVIATSGTSLTTEQVQILARYTRNLYFLYDADSAGLTAMLRGLELILDQDCDPRIVLLPTGEDPDSFVLKHGGPALRKRVDEGRPLVDFITEKYRNEGQLGHPDGQAKAVHHIISLVARIDDPLKRDMYVRHISAAYALSERLLYGELAKVRKQSRRRDAQRMTEPAPVTPSEEASRAEKVPRWESTFLSLLLTAAPQIQREALQEIRVEHIRDRRLQYLLHLVLEQYEHEGEIRIPALESQLADDLTMQNVLADLLMDRDTVSDRWSEIQTVTEPDHQRVLLDAYRKLVLHQMDDRNQRLQEELRDVKDEERSVQIVIRLQEALHVQNEILGASSFHALADLEHRHQELFVT